MIDAGSKAAGKAVSAVVIIFSSMCVFVVTLVVVRRMRQFHNTEGKETFAGHGDEAAATADADAEHVGTRSSTSDDETFEEAHDRL